MAFYLSLVCEKDESAVARIERAKGEGLLPADAYKGPVKRNLSGSYPTPQGVDILGDVRDRQVSYFICQRRTG